MYTRPGATGGDWEQIMRHSIAVICLIVLLCLGGCATVDVSVDEAAPERSLPPGASANDSSIEEYVAPDGRRLAYVRYRASGARTALVYLHGIESHEGWFALAARELSARGYDVFCLDRRGSGINRENRGFRSGHVDSFETLHADIDKFVEGLRGRYSSVFVVGLSWGGKLALSYALTHPDEIEGLVLITPGLRSRVDVSSAEKLKIVTLQALNPTSPVPTPIEPEMFTTTPKYLHYIREDPLRLRYASVRFFWQTHRLDNYIDERMPANTLPIQVFLAGRDRIIDNHGVLKVLERGGQDSLDVVTYPDQTHSIQVDAFERLVDDMTRWLRQRAP